MLDKQLINLANTKIQSELKEQETSLYNDIRQLQNKTEALGGLPSGALVGGAKDLCIQSIKIQSKLIWNNLHRVVSTVGISYSESLSEELKTIVQHNLPENLPCHVGIMKDIFHIARLPTLVSSEDVLHPLYQSRKDALTNIEAEVDLFVMSIQNKKEGNTPEQTSTTLNFNAPVGAVQTGNNSTANVTQNLTPEVKEQITNALDEILQKIEQMGIELQTPKQELVEIIEDSKAEFQKDTPNITKLKDLLPGIGTAIQTIASLKPAYDVLKYALLPIGINLP